MLWRPFDIRGLETAFSIACTAFCFLVVLKLLKSKAVRQPITDSIDVSLK